MERGPVVFALESTDHQGHTVNGVRVDSDLLDSDGVVTVSVHDLHLGVDAWPYGEAEPTTVGPGTRVELLPYHSWGNRGPSTMRIWMPMTQHQAVK